ncbi:glycoside hydrolase family 32 protein [Microbacterium sp.]|uniref:glycoside hydrolase family 32 protein n=1 Tax=Microbacterium sp. TaxID=51671 RepID=UPI0032214BC3
MTASADQTHDLRTRALADPYRPAYHFAAPAGWLNDPNGAAQRDGVYHLFYQYNPHAPAHASIHWGHAVSRDLVRWTDRPIALRPDADGPDAAGCWSGVLVDDGGRPVIVYTGFDRDWRTTTCLAYGDATLDVWEKDPRNPVIPAPPDDLEVTAFRDHCVWREGGAWRQVIGSGVVGQGGAALLYESDDLVSWRALGPLAVGDALAGGPEEWTGTVWECVDFFRLRTDGTTAAPEGGSGDPHVLIFSAWDAMHTLHAHVALGRYEGDRFLIDGYQRLDLGEAYAYAPQSFADESGRRVVWAWMQEGRRGPAQLRAGWSGAMALPRRMWLDEDGVVRMEPVAEVESLRGAALEWRQDGAVSRAEGRHVELALDADVPAGGVVRLAVFATDDGAEETVIELAAGEGGALVLSLDRSRSTLDEACDRTPRGGEVSWRGGSVPVRVFLDSSSVEVFAGGISLTARVYPTRAEATGIRVEASGGAEVSGVRGWALAAVEQADRVVDPQA